MPTVMEEVAQLMQRVAALEADVAALKQGGASAPAQVASKGADAPAAQAAPIADDDPDAVFDRCLAKLEKIELAGTHTHPLFWAAENGDVELATMLLDKGENVSMKDKNEKTPLHLAAGNGHVPMAELLISKGADQTYRDDKYDAPIHSAIRTGQTAMVKYLLKRLPETGVALDDLHGYGSTTAISVAKESNQPSLVALLRMHGGKDGV